MTWKEAIIEVLKQSKKAEEYVPMNYRDITNAIFDAGLINPEGKKTPAQTVNNILNTNKDIFQGVGDGEYKLNCDVNEASPAHTHIKNKSSKKVASESPDKLIQSYGMYWTRDGIDWNGTPKLLGVESFGTNPIDLSNMRGIYMLYDGREVVYVGQATESILKRLIQHTKNRLATRWNRFSWFGIDCIDKDGKLHRVGDELNITPATLIDALEAILIEGLEPRQNRRQGDNFGFEYYQVSDNKIEPERILNAIKKLV